MASKRGFTLLELMIVIIIIGVLASLGVMQYQTVIEKARGAEAKQILGQLRSACAAIWMERGTTAGTDGCIENNLSLSSSTTVTPGQLPGAGGCWTTHFFNYIITSRGTNVIAFTANRCLKAGKTPNYTGSGSPSLKLEVDYMGQDSWVSSVIGY